MKIRQERKEDFDKIYELVKTAFKTAQVSDGTEQDFVIKLRKNENYIPKLALVAVEGEKIIGHIMLTKFSIKYKDKVYPTLLLAPLCVCLEWRNKKVGSKLVEQVLQQAKKLGYTSVFLVGNPVYYSRFGFRQSKDFNIINVNNIPHKFVQCCELKENALKRIEGTINL